MKRRGFALLEIMLIMGVITVATVAIVGTYRTVSFRAKVNQTYADVMELTENIQGSWGIMQSYNGLNNSIAVEQNLVPSRMQDGTTLRSPLGPLTLGYAGSDRDSLSISIELEGEGCVKLVPLLSQHMDQILIGSPGQSATVSEGGQTNISEVARLCEHGASVSFIHYQKGFGRRAAWESW